MTRTQQTELLGLVNEALMYVPLELKKRLEKVLDEAAVEQANMMFDRLKADSSVSMLRES